jgi:hypothetical protein
MLLANLDNEVIFKKAFTDPFVFRAFVKDILDIDFEVDVIETEKQFEPKMAYIDFKLDIFAQSKDQRVVVEIQRIEYDYNFDRFLHYFLMAIAEMQRSSKEYALAKTVYTIVVLTAPYTVEDKTGRPIKNEVLISKLNPRNLQGEEIPIFGHELVFLNAYHRDDFTPPNYRDWLDLIYQSIHHSEDPDINLSKPGIQRTADIISVDNLTPTERAESKRAESTRAAKKHYENYAKRRERAEVIENLLKQGILTIEQIADAMQTSVEVVKAIQNQMQ